jgi:hypothetical protein
MGKAISSHVVSSTSGYGPNRSVALAKSLQVSDVWLVKTCRLSDIPLPPRGYWAKFGCPKGTDFFVRVRREVAPVIVSARKE